MIDILTILISLGLLMYLAFRGITLLVLAPAMALLAALLTGGLPLLAAYTQIFMVSTGGFIIAFFPLFMLDALPHNGAVITILGICKLGHREAYFDVFMVAVVAPMLSLVVLILMATLFGWPPFSARFSARSSRHRGVAIDLGEGLAGLDV